MKSTWQPSPAAPNGSSQAYRSNPVSPLDLYPRNPRDPRDPRDPAHGGLYSYGNDDYRLNQNFYGHHRNYSEPPKLYHYPQDEQPDPFSNQHQRRTGPKVRFPDQPAEHHPPQQQQQQQQRQPQMQPQQLQQNVDFSAAFPGYVPTPKTSKSLPGSRRNSFSKEDLEALDPDGHFSTQSLLSSLLDNHSGDVMAVPQMMQPPQRQYTAPQRVPQGVPQGAYPNNPMAPNYYQGPPNPSQAPYAAPPPTKHRPLSYHDDRQPPGPYYGRKQDLPTYHGVRRDSLGLNGAHNSPNIPPQFSAHFLQDDEYEPLASGSPAAPSYVKKYLNNIASDSTQFPILLRRDSIPGMLSVSSAALDLAPLPQTRRSSIDRGQQDHTRAIPDVHRYGSPLRKEVLNNAEAKYQQGAAGVYFSPPKGQFNEDLAEKAMRRVRSEEHLLSSMKQAMPQSTTSARVDTNSPDWDGTENGKPLGYCKFFRQGFCSRGDKCKFPHITSSPNPEILEIPSPGLSAGTHSPTLNTPPHYHSFHPMATAGSNSARSSPISHDHQGGYHAHGILNMINEASPPGDSPIKLNNKLTSPLKKGHKRSTSAPEAPPRFASVEQLVGQIYQLCRDQHGCRYLQKKLEEGKEDYVEIILNEVSEHLLELMSDPFGNYLCQKLFVYANEQQRTHIANTVAHGLVDVSMNMHGTRSVQKLIDCMMTPEQINIIIKALDGHVVRLIKDLNGNHVVQKCLNKLAPEQNQFIYDSVTKHCIEVSSHRHGCCVFQRCIDHASPAQKAQLAAEVTVNALPLVQDAFGNYVVQYILDLNVREFSRPLISRFVDHVFPLSLQKFSSNVIEKCIRVSDPDIRRGLIANIIDKDKLPAMLQDNFANYVVQTSLDVSDPDQHYMLAELVKPILPAIRHLPYCKRVQSKLNRDQPAIKMIPMPIYQGVIPLPHQMLHPGGSMS